ncbi:amino acid permease-domain-containing protein [Umbelopsis sp. AD052]|nr:amino acid permease-domain-containing protein [Umbelopsis sp. AD052]
MSKRDSSSKQTTSSNQSEPIPVYKTEGRTPSITSVNEVVPPSFAESEFQTIQRRQVKRLGTNLLKWSETPSRYPTLSNEWEFAGWGSTYYMELEQSDINVQREDKKLIGQWRATSISGNDLIASVLYSLGPCMVQAGQFSAISMALVALLMYPAKNIMTEVCTALPLNGGIYSAMLNSSSKWLAGVVASVLILDYLATCVVSAASAAAYLAAEVALPDKLPAFALAIIIMVAFALIAFLGIRESSTVALIIFLFHLITMLTLLIASIIHWGQVGNATLIANWNYPYPENSSAAKMIFSGFCVGLLGVTGYETAGNFIEELQPSDFPKVMRNMFGFLTLLNTPITLVATALVPIEELRNNSAIAVSILGQYAVGGHRWLRIWIMVDAVIVLCAGVLTGLIAATGLMERMASDRIIPSFFLIHNKFTGSAQYIILAFLILSVTLYSIVRGDTTSLSGVFAVAFLSVLLMFTIVNVLMKYKRNRLPRHVSVNLLTTVTVGSFVVAGLVGNIVIDPSIIEYFIIYFGVVLLVILTMINRVWLYKTFYWLADQLPLFHRFHKLSEMCQKSILQGIKKFKKQPVVFFAKTDEPHILNKAIMYCQNNEPTGNIKIVHLYESLEDIPKHFEANHSILDEIYPKIQIDLIFIQGIFNPSTVDAISRQLEIPTSLMFITCPGKNFRYSIAEFNGMRIVML